MKTILFLASFALITLSTSTPKREVKKDVTKSLKILNIHETKDAKILLA